MNKFTLWIFGCIILFSCQPKQLTPNEYSSRFLSDELKLEFHKLMNEFYQENSNTAYPEFSVLITERYFYLTVFRQNLNCPQSPPFYEFKEKFGNVDVWFMITANSHQPERFFEMNNLKLNETIPPSMNLCHPNGYWYRYKIDSDLNLSLENKVKIIEGSPEEDLIVEEDEKYRMARIEEIDFE